MRSPFRRVLFASNFSTGFEGSFQAVLHFCQMNHASLRLLHVRKVDAALGTEAGLLTDTGAMDKSALQLLRQMKDRAVALGVSCTTRLETGVASEKILAEIESAQIDLAILGTSEPRGSKRLAFGATAEKVMRKARCPIMTVGLVAADLMTPNAARGPVIFATDFHSITRQAIHLAVTYCKSTDLRLHCLHVLPRTLQPAPGDQTLPELLTCALKHLVATSPVPIDESVYHVSFGSEISNAVVDYARQQAASLIILGVRRASILSADDPLPIVYRIITEAPCPVMTILFDADPDPECQI
jgi:nucleotide-binding universal stress UspA family protein